MSQQPARKSSQGGVKNRQPLFTVSVTRPRLIAGIVAGVIAIGWIFLLGMVAGRMYPSLLSREQADSAGSRTAAVQEASTAQTAGSTVLRAEELSYQDRTGAGARGGASSGSGSGSGAQGGTAVSQANQGNQAGQSGQVASGSLGSSQATTVAAGTLGTGTPQSGAGSTSQTVGQAAGQTASAGASAQAELSTERFNYVIQVASFKEATQAQSLLQRMQSDGLKAYLVEGEASGSVWYRVYVDFQGTESEVRDVKSSFGKYGIRDTLTRSKRPVQ